jgi:hypothetical protein
VTFGLTPHREDPHRVEVSSAVLAVLERAQAARDEVPALTPERAREVDARAIEDEVLYREAERLGLDRDDPIIRQRLIQKLLLLIEDLGGASRAPTESELRAYFEASASRYALPPRVHLVHVFASGRAGLPPAEGLALSGVPASGEAFPVPREVRASREELGRDFGPDFAAAVFALEPGRWSEPIASTHGWHRVRLVDREAGRAPSFEQVRAALALDYALDRRAKVIGDYLKRTVRDYRVDVDGRPLDSFSPTHRVAVRTVPSAED